MGEYSLYNPSIDKNPDYLAHHGILGMKWGIRRYQNPDGSLTPLGRKRAGYVKSHPRLDTAVAKSMYKKKSKENDRLSKTLAKMSEQHQKKADALKNVDAEKASEHERKASLYSNNSEVYKKVSEIFSQKVKDIDSGAIKAGEDFIVQIDKNWYGLFSTTEKRVIEIPKGENASKEKKGNDGSAILSNEKPLSNDSNKIQSEEKSRMMETARKTDSYDMGFLESIQNSYVLEAPQKEVLREYSKYLDNPRTYTAPPETRPSTKSKTHADKIASRVKAMQGQYTQAEIAEKLGISPSYVSSLLS